MKNCLAIGNDELGEPVGLKERCPKCKKMHKVEYGDKVENGKAVPSKMLAFIKCGKSAYLVGIDGRKI